ncbi:tetratricopeptide repeat protein [Haladaptatus sp. NG-SE-30]
MIETIRFLEVAVATVSTYMAAISAGIAAGIAGNALYDIGRKSASKYKEILRTEDFSGSIASLGQEFENSLKDTLVEKLSEDGKITPSDVEKNWDEITGEINSIDSLFATKEDAIVRITEGVIKGSGYSLDNNSDLRGEIEISVARAYRTSVTHFLNQIQDEELEQIFVNESHIRVNEAVNKIDTRLLRVESRIIQRRDAEIRNEGFDRLDPLYFRRKKASSPEIAWRRGFEPIEVESGYALERERPEGQTAGRKRVTKEIIDYLQNGGSLVLLGSPGSGKSTICKQVACEWHDLNPGNVFYRRSGSAAPLKNPGTIIEAVAAADGNVLIVVEDAVDEDASVLFELLKEFKNEQEVSFLLDSRQSQWEESNNTLAGPGLENLRASLETVEVPDLDVEECRRIIDHFEKVTGQSVQQSADILFEEVRSADYGGPLLLAYMLTGPISGDISSSRGISAFEFDVQQSLTRLEEADEIHGTEIKIRHQVSLLINVLNASRLPVSKEFIFLLGNDSESHWEIDEILGYFEGWLVVESEDDSRYRTFHERWSTLYLSYYYEQYGIRAIRTFEECISTLFDFFDNPDSSDYIKEWIVGDFQWITEIKSHPQEYVDLFLTSIGQIASRRPELAPLFLNSNISTPNSASGWGKFLWYNSTGLSAVYSSRYPTAETEFENALQVISSSSDSVEENMKKRSVVLENLGTAKRKQGKLRDSWEDHKESLEISEELEDNIGIAESLNNLGAIEISKNNLEYAEFLLGESLELKKEVGDMALLPATLDNLGLIERQQGNLGDSEEYLRESLEIEREIGEENGIAKSLNNLGMTLKQQGELKSAEECHKEALKIFDNIDNSQGVATTKGNIGLVDYERGNPNSCLNTLSEVYDAFVEIGAIDKALDSAKNIVLINKEAGNNQKAIEWCEIGEKLASNHGQLQKSEIFQTLKKKD